MCFSHLYLVTYINLQDLFKNQAIRLPNNPPLSIVFYTFLKCINCKSMLPTPPIWLWVFRDQSRDSHAFTHELIYPLNKSVPGTYHTPKKVKIRQHLCSGLISAIIAYALSLVLYVLSERRAGSPIQATWTIKAKVIPCRKMSWPLFWYVLVCSCHTAHMWAHGRQLTV